MLNFILKGLLAEDALRNLVVPNYAECVTFSPGSLGGVDAGPNPTRLMCNISNIEPVWGSIYGMLIIGKLPGLSRQE